MKTVAVISQKGGAGKTTIAIHLAVASSLDNKNTAIIDLDPQASSAKWSDRRLQLSDVPVVLSAVMCCLLILRRTVTPLHLKQQK